MMRTLLLEVGPPGSGKSGHAYMLEQKYGFTRISQDDQGREHLDLFKNAISKGKDVVVDRMGFSKQQRNRYIEPARKAGYDIRIVVHHVPKAICLERMLEREGHPTIKNEKSAQSALKTFFGKYERVEDDEADLVVRLGHDNVNRPLAIICDIDGTMADIEHRRHHLNREEGKKPNWKKFFDDMVHDTVNHWCYDIISSLATQYPIVFATGRPDSYHKETYQWLYENKINMNELYMRPRFDCRKDDIIKEIILEFEILPRYKPHFVLDDRQQVVDMWRKRGLTVLQCAVGDF